MIRQPQVYEPHKQLKLGIRIWGEMFGELFEFRELIWSLFVRDLSAKYKQSILGNAWVVLMPVVMIGTFVSLNHAGIVHIQQTPMPYPIYAMTGLAVWQIFATGINSGANSLVGAGDLITKINFPREVLVIASLAQSIFEFFIKMMLIVLLCVYYQFVPSWMVVFVPLTILPLLFLTIGLALMLSLLNGIVRDIANMVSMLLMFLMFLTPVLYPVPDNNLVFFKLNILAPLINVPRDLMAFGHVSGAGDYLFACAVSVLFFLLSWRMFHLVETKIPERV